MSNNHETKESWHFLFDQQPKNWINTKSENVYLKMSWTEAQGYCRAEYSDLATITDGNDISRINNITKDWDRPFWIGLYDDVSSWKWSLVDEHFYTGVYWVYKQWQEDQSDNACNTQGLYKVLKVWKMIKVNCYVFKVRNMLEFEYTPCVHSIFHLHNHSCHPKIF